MEKYTKMHYMGTCGKENRMKAQKAHTKFVIRDAKF